MKRTTAASCGMSSCHVCYKLASQSAHQCPRCGASMHQRKPGSLQRTLALLVTGCLLYIPANLLPIMITDQLGSSEPSTIIGGVVLLVQLGSIPVAGVIFIASVMVPISKFAAMYYLCWCAAKEAPSNALKMSKLYRITEFIGKWSMVDVFVVAILVALVSLGGVLVIRPGAAAMAFAGMVMVTMVAAESFDPRLLWDKMDDVNE